MCNGNCRTTYGKIFVEKTGEHDCVYCDMDLWGSHEGWKCMTLDHVVPQAAWKDKEIFILPEFCHDYTNAALCCSTCNSFDNQFWLFYRTNLLGRTFDTWDKCWDLRDEIFSIRMGRIQKCIIRDRQDYKRQNPAGKGQWIRLRGSKDILTAP
jgi:hypothetical protein